jgi:hypothetical protein
VGLRAKARTALLNIRTKPHHQIIELSAKIKKGARTIAHISPVDGK